MKMIVKLAPVLAFAAILLVAQGAAAYHTEVNLDRPTLSDVQGALMGQPGRPGLLAAGRPFKAKFRDVVVTGPEALQVKQIVADAAANLPPDSEISLRGSIDGRSFDAEMQNSKGGQKEARLDGLIFVSREEAMRFLDALRDRGVRDLKLAGFAEGRRVHGRIEDGRTNFEG